MITTFQDMKSIIDFMKEGAYDYIQKPLDIDEVERVVTLDMPHCGIGSPTSRNWPTIFCRRQPPSSAAGRSNSKKGVLEWLTIHSWVGNVRNCLA